MQVGVDVKCMHINFVGHGLFDFGDKISFQIIFAKFLFRTMDYMDKSIVVENFNQSELSQKIMQVGVDVLCMHTNFGGCGLSCFGYKFTFKFSQISFLYYGLVLH